MPTLMAMVSCPWQRKEGNWGDGAGRQAVLVLVSGAGHRPLGQLLKISTIHAACSSVACPACALMAGLVV